MRDVVRHTSPFSGGWWFVFMVGLRLVGVFVVAGVFVSLTSLELVARRCVILCDTHSPFSGGWWFVFMVGLRLVGVFVVAGVFASLTSSEW